MQIRRYHIVFQCTEAYEPIELLPPGNEVADKLRTDLANRDIPVGELDIWRDSGWVWHCFPKGNRTQRIELIVARFNTDKWILAVSYVHPLLVLLMHRYKNATLRTITEALIEILKTDDYCDVQWYWRTPAFGKNVQGRAITSINDFEATI